MLGSGYLTPQISRKVFPRRLRKDARYTGELMCDSAPYIF